jgi:SHS2 domain-containing protein
MVEPEDTPIPGVRGLDHTADLGLEIRAPELSELFRRAALGAMWLVLERQPEQSKQDPLPTREGEERPVELAEEDLTTLLRSWLRTVLFWDETEGFVIVDSRLILLPTPLCNSPGGQAFGLRGEVVGRFDSGPRVREIKGVTLHGLRVECLESGWFGSVIFDV